MAGFFRQVAQMFGAGPIETRVLMVGLDKGGSTQLLYALHRGTGDFEETIPTIG
jgi:ADP-ribosylation factor family